MNDYVDKYVIIHKYYRSTMLFYKIEKVMPIF